MAGSAAGSADPLFAELLDRAVATLRGGGLVVAPTETLLGLLADPFSAEAVRRLVAAKRRPAGEAFPLLLPAHDAWRSVARLLPPAAARLAAAFWPGPLTLLLPARDDLPPEMVGPEGTVAVRLPGDCAAARIAARFGAAAARPLIATSANLRGALPPSDAATLDPRLGAAVDLVVPGRAGGARPSTLVACVADGYRIVRAGAIPESAIRGALA